MPEIRVHRWDDLPLERVTEMVARKVVIGQHQTMVQVHLKRGTQVPLHRHGGEQMIYVLQGAMRWTVGGREMIVKGGDVLIVPPGARHQAEALDDTFQVAVLSEGGLVSRVAGRQSRGGSRNSGH